MPVSKSRASYSWRYDHAVPRFPDDRPVVIFDGYCVFCSKWASFLLRRDRRGRFRLLPAQSPLAQALYAHYGLDPKHYETNVLLAEGHAFFKSEASIRIAEGLGLPWSLARALRALLLRWREALYDRVARNRLRIFGARETCYRPEKTYEDRFLG